jgi:hypothetical protein
MFSSGLNISVLANRIAASSASGPPTKGTKSSPGLSSAAFCKAIATSPFSSGVNFLLKSTAIPLPTRLLPIWSATNTSDTGSVIAPIVSAALTAGLVLKPHIFLSVGFISLLVFNPPNFVFFCFEYLYLYTCLSIKSSTNLVCLS